MQFTSQFYLLFVAVCFVVYWLVPSVARKPWLVFASFTFYASWKWNFVFLLLAVSLFNWSYARWALRRWPSMPALLVGIGVNVGVLLYFKYLTFLLENLAALAGLVGVSWGPAVESPLVPLGVSFFTFQGIAYLFDVTAGDEPFDRLLDFLVFKAFWPQLIAGPIIRPGEIREQIERPPGFDAATCGEGCRRILVGLFKKAVLADNLAAPADLFFRSTSTASALDAVVGVLAFGLQIYFDFSAYSDIAIGSAKLFGFVFPENFDWPYRARSPQEFWNRWHLSLSRWIRDYLFTPLSFATRDQPMLSRAWPLATMAICGLWHGPKWTFICWGLWHGSLLLLQQTVLKRFFAAPSPADKSATTLLRCGLAMAVTFVLVQTGWLFFRAQSLAQVGEVVQTVLTGRGGWSLSVLDLNSALLVLVFLVGVTLLPKILEGANRLTTIRLSRECWLQVGRPALDVVLVHAIVVFGQQAKAFVYFQF